MNHTFERLSSFDDQLIHVFHGWMRSTLCLFLGKQLRSRKMFSEGEGGGREDETDFPYFVNSLEGVISDVFLPTMSEIVSASSAIL